MVNYQNNIRYVRNGCGPCQNYSAKNEHIKQDEMRCEKKEKDLSEQVLPVMACVKCQKWRKIYDETKGFQRGTMFEVLDKPFLGRGGCNR